MVASYISMSNCSLRERRGSSVSLTIDLGQFQSSALEISPINEDIAEELERNRPGRLTRYQLHHLNISASLSMIYAEFAALPSPSTSSCEKVAGCSQKNRHTLWPIRETRVRLSSSYRASCNSAAEDVCHSYINANYILDSNSELMYIAAEGPMPNTVNDFWSMVLQERTPAIVMVTNLEEKPCGAKLPLVQKCEKYWPDGHACYGEIDVTVVSTNFHNGVQIRHIVLNFGASRVAYLVYGMVRSPFAYATYHSTSESNRCYGKLQKRISTIVLSHSASSCPLQCWNWSNLHIYRDSSGVDQLCKTPENIDVFSTVSRLRRQSFQITVTPSSIDVPSFQSFQQTSYFISIPRCYYIADLELYSFQDKTLDDENSKPGNENDDELLWNNQADLLCCSF
ncbi:hypothetical protein DINM_021965 [Dirofilaria immitis]|nr:hypothetical protein [Dirofilaria immitis]